MNRYLVILAVCCIVAVVFSVSNCKRIKQEKDRIEYNQGVLLDTMRVYKVRDSLNAASIGVLTLTAAELRKYRAEDAQLIKDLNLRLSRVLAVGNTSTEGSYDVNTELIRDTIRISDTIRAVQRIDYRTPYIDIKGTIAEGKLTAAISVRDTLAQVFHRVPKFKFLGIWFGTKGIRQEIISKNPHTKISFAEYIEIKKR